MEMDDILAHKWAAEKLAREVLTKVYDDFRNNTGYSLGSISVDVIDTSVMGISIPKTSIENVHCTVKISRTTELI